MSFTHTPGPQPDAAYQCPTMEKGVLPAGESCALPCRECVILKVPLAILLSEVWAQLDNTEVSVISAGRCKLTKGGYDRDSMSDLE